MYDVCFTYSSKAGPTTFEFIEKAEEFNDTTPLNPPGIGIFLPGDKDILPKCLKA